VCEKIPVYVKRDINVKRDISKRPVYVKINYICGNRPIKKTYIVNYAESV